MKIKASKRGRVNISLTKLEAELLYNLCTGEDPHNLPNKIAQVLPDVLRQAEQNAFELERRKADYKRLEEKRKEDMEKFIYGDTCWKR